MNATLLKKSFCGLHFERSHSGIPDIDPDAHRLLIHGLVKRPLIFTLEALARYPMESRITFIARET